VIQGWTTVYLALCCSGAKDAWAESLGRKGGHIVRRRVLAHTWEMLR